jgi:hypothetical protein
MSNDLAVVGSFRALEEGNAAAALLEANLGGAALRSSDLTWVKIPTGGATRWSWSNKAGAEFSEKAITGLLVVVSKTEQVLWPHVDAASGSRPLLVSLDGVTGHKIGSDYGDLDPNVIEAAKRADGTYDWKKIPYCQWQGQGKGAKPPRAKSSRVLGVLREEDNQPVFVRVSSTSLRAVDDLLRGITAEGLFHFRAIVELTLEKRKGARADYAVLVAKSVGSVDEQTGMLAKGRFTDTMTNIVCPPIEDRVSRAQSSVLSADEASEVPF